MFSRRKKSNKDVYHAAWERGRSAYHQRQNRSVSCAFCLSLRQRLGAWIEAARSKLAEMKTPVRRENSQDYYRVTVFLQAMRSGLSSILSGIRKAVVSGYNRLSDWLASQWNKRPADQQNVDYRFRALRYPGSRDRRYRVHIPPGYNGRTPTPVVMVLHGCRQTQSDIQRISAFDKVADANGFLVVYPFVTSYSGLRNRNCWGWWLREQIHAGGGEVEDLWQILREVQANYCVDKNRLHVIGLSSGAGMSVALMVARAGKIASGAAVAGVPYGETARAVGFVRHITGHFRPVHDVVREMDLEMGDKKRLVPLFVVHSHDDETVNIQAARNLRDSWASCFGIPLHRHVGTKKGAIGTTRWEHVRYRGTLRRTALETLFLEGPGHGWYGGDPGRYSYPQAPDVAEWSWRFFQSHPMGAPIEETVGVEPMQPTQPVGYSQGDTTYH